MRLILIHASLLNQLPNTFSHTLNVFTGKFSLCNFPITQPQNPVVPPIIIGPII